MTQPRIVFLVHGGPESAESVRARELSRRRDPTRIHILLRDAARRRVASAWHAELQRLQPEVVYVLNTGLPGAPLACWWRRIHGIPFILDTGDAIYELVRSAGLRPRWQWPIVRFIERQTLQRAHTVVVRGTRHQQYLRTEGLPKVELIRDGYFERPTPSTASVEALRTKLGLSGKFVVGLLGSLHYSPKLNICYGWDLIEALAEFDDIRVRGLIIGDGPGRPWLEEHARRHGVHERITFCGRVAYDELPLYLRSAEVVLSTQTNNVAGQVRTTGKLPEYMAAGCFILASRVGEAAIVLPDAMLLDFDGDVDISYPRRLAAALRALFDNPTRLAARETLPQLARRLFSYDELSLHFDRVIESAVCAESGKR
jgi:glycosyltransferase involved in cell wall biosynthesis